MKKGAGAVMRELPESKPFRVYKVTRSGSSRYLNVGSVLPKDWIAVKMTVETFESDLAILKLERIK